MLVKKPSLAVKILICISFKLSLFMADRLEQLQIKSPDLQQSSPLAAAFDD